MQSSKLEICVAIIKFLANNSPQTQSMIQILTKTPASRLADCLIFLEQQKLIRKISNTKIPTYTNTPHGLKVSEFFETKTQNLQKAKNTTNQSSNFT